MSGAPRGAIVRAYLTIATLIAAIDTVNVFTVLADSARYGTHLATWKPIIWEATSGVSTVLVCGIAYLALRVALPGRARWPFTLFVHVIASFFYSVLHVGLMAAARSAIYAVVGLHYRMALSDWPYEYRKDVLAYILLCAIFLFFSRRQAEIKNPSASLPASFDIIDGPSLIRVAIAEISAVRAAGNYVEFILTDGRTQLMRASLNQMEERFAPERFVRTHRSWLVNSASVCGMTATGSGDFSIDLRGTVTAPLSRRYSIALATLRASRDGKKSNTIEIE